MPKFSVLKKVTLRYVTCNYRKQECTIGAATQMALFTNRKLFWFPDLFHLKHLTCVSTLEGIKFEMAHICKLDFLEGCVLHQHLEDVKWH